MQNNSNNNMNIKVTVVRRIGVGFIGEARTVERRCATTSVVRPAASRSSAWGHDAKACERGKGR